MTSRSEAQAVLARLRREAPRFAPGPPEPHARPPSRVLEWLVSEVPLGGSSLEVGCGWSTIALGLVADRHVAVAPDPAEHEALRHWAKTADVALDGVELVVARAEHHLPTATADGRLEPETFDLVLVDGDHAHPHPTVDAFHSGPLVRPGGLLVLERAGIRSVADAGRGLRTAGWSLRQRVDDALVLQRPTSTAPPTDRAAPVRWWEQPGNGETPTLEDRLRAWRRRLCR